MKRKIIAFDLDDTLAVTKSPISDHMSALLSKLLKSYEVCVISGGKFEQFKIQVVERLDVSPELLDNLHLMPTCGTRYYRYKNNEWKQEYAEDLSSKDKELIIKVLTEGAKHLGYWEEEPYGEVVEDRGSQITFSALGQQAPPEEKYKWDPSGIKKHKLRDYAEPFLPHLEVRVGGTTSVDVTKIGIDKAYGMQKLISLLGINKSDILFVGDKLEEGGNDYPVKAMGIDTIAVERWEDTALVIETILAIS